ncbi:hypothetical protein DBP60_26220 [Salmonella enterica subsp. enterica serovar 4,[5],12:i:-]|nr:hypothetical protein DBP60_26220 [Salmonella enterica subsp. enterica serovar 4,[5],12:i:-]
MSRQSPAGAAATISAGERAAGAPAADWCAAACRARAMSIDMRAGVARGAIKRKGRLAPAADTD